MSDHGVTYPVTPVKAAWVAGSVIPRRTATGYVTDVVTTRIHKHAKGRLYPREHRRAKKLSAETVAGRLGIERESVLRMERELHRFNQDKQIAYAAAIGIEPSALWHPPPLADAPESLDDLVAREPDEVKRMAADIVRRLVAGGKR